MEITLRPVTQDNWEECIQLKVREDQRNFVASNLYSIAESKFYPELQPMGIYADDKLVGFLMHGLEPEDGRYWLVRFMIDQRYQGQGLGRAAMQVFLQEMRSIPGLNKLFLSYEPENAVAEKLYSSLGFQPTGEYIEGEKVACLEW